MSVKTSRSELKRQFKQIERAAKELSQLSDSDLHRLPGSETLKDEIVRSRKTKAGARKRQIKFIAKLLKNEDLDSILQFLNQKKGSKLEEINLLHDAERLRDAIVNEALNAYEICRQVQLEWNLDWESPTIKQVVQEYAYLDELEVRRSAHQYARNRSKSHYREIYRIIRAAAEKHRLEKRSTRANQEHNTN